MSNQIYPPELIEAAEKEYPYPNKFSRDIIIGEKLLVDGKRQAFLKGLSLAMPLVEVLIDLLHLHSCEQEGLLSGKPTGKMWFDAVNNASEALANFPQNDIINSHKE